MIWEKTGYIYLSSLLILSHMTALQDDTTDHSLFLFTSLTKFHCAVGYQRWYSVDPQHLRYSFHLFQILYIYNLYLYFLITSATICLLQKNKEDNVTENVTVPTSFWNIFDWPSPHSLLPSPQPCTVSSRYVLNRSDCHNLLLENKCGPALFSTLHTSITYPQLSLPLFVSISLLLTRYNPVKSILTGNFFAMSAG